MVVLQESGSPIQAPAALLETALDYRQTPTCLKMLPKRYINLHQWIGPLCPKEIKAQLMQTLFYLDKLELIEYSHSIQMKANNSKEIMKFDG
ncbi:putative RNA binding protein [Trypoxylus dichotomus]